jgi:hypothetical protein
MTTLAIVCIALNTLVSAAIAMLIWRTQRDKLPALQSPAYRVVFALGVATQSWLLLAMFETLAASWVTTYPSTLFSVLSSPLPFILVAIEAVCQVSIALYLIVIFFAHAHKASFFYLWPVLIVEQMVIVVTGPPSYWQNLWMKPPFMGLTLMVVALVIVEMIMYVARKTPRSQAAPHDELN